MSEEKLDPVKLVELGRVQKPHGLRGELCIEPYADSPFIFEGLTRVYLQLPGKKPKPCVLESWRPHQGRALLDSIRIIVTGEDSVRISLTTKQRRLLLRKLALPM